MYIKNIITDGNITDRTLFIKISEIGGFHSECQQSIEHGCPAVHQRKNTVNFRRVESYINWCKKKV